MRLRTCMVMLLVAGTALSGEKPPLPKVRKERPRIFWRAKAWDGPSVEKVRGWIERPEYKGRLAKLEDRLKLKGGQKNMKLAIKWMLLEDREAGRQLLDRFMSQRSGGHSPSYWGITDQRMAACYDWLHKHPGFTPEMKKNRCEYLALRCRGNMAYLKEQRENPFYSRFAGALAGLTACALAIHGDHPDVDEYLRFAYQCFREKMSSIRRAEDGGTGGSSYGFHHEFTDLANTVAAWRSATDWDAARWIKEEQGNWLERQMLFQVWMTYPNGYFVKDGDGWGRDTCDKWQYRMQIDAISGMYNSGWGRSAALAVGRRWGLADYHAQHMWEWFVFNNPEIKPRPLAELGRTEVFSPELLGMVCWRSSWKPDATIVHFRAGESPDTHGTADQGKFIIFKRRPLAIKNGDYVGFGSPVHRYYRSPWSANSLVFTREEADGKSVAINFPKFSYSGSNLNWPRGLFSFEEWKALREKSTRSGRKDGSPFAAPPMGKLLAREANERYARALADLSLFKRRQGGDIPGKVWDWKRELVFLGYKYLLVLDRVKTEPGVSHRWTLHATFEPKVDGTLAIADNGPARLFCKTLLPEKPAIRKVGGPGYECDWNGRNPLPEGWKSIVRTADGKLGYTYDRGGETGTKVLGPDSQMGAWRLDVIPADGAAECVYLHVLYPTDTGTGKMPDSSVQKKGADLAVKVGELSYTFCGGPTSFGRP